jgi:sphinganine C4-monooxygenase
VEGFLLDSLGAVLAETLTRMNIRQAMFLFTFSSLKTVDDHCGYNLPWDPLQLMSKNNADYHDIHHQVRSQSSLSYDLIANVALQRSGMKSNFAQPFFVHWDTILGTRMTRDELERHRQNKQSKSQ